MSDVLYVLAASYDDVADALTEYEAIEVAYRHVGSSHDFDATVIARDDAGKVEIVRRHERGSMTALRRACTGVSRPGRWRRCSRRWASSVHWPSAAAPGLPSGR